MKRTFVYRDGEIVERVRRRQAPGGANGNALPTPHVSRPLSYESPVTGKEITSWRERDADLKAADACDPRDLGSNFEFRRGRDVQFEEAKSGREFDDIWQ